MVVSGMVQAAEVKFGPRQEGRVQEVLVEEGQQLKKGQVILTLENNEMLDEKDSLNATVRTQRDYITQLRNGPTSQEINSAKAEMNSVLADLERQKKSLQRKRELFSQQIIAKDSLDEIEGKVNSLQQKYSSLKSKYEDLLDGTRPDQIQTENSRLKIYEAQLLGVQSKLKELQVISPCDCELSEFTIKPGNLVLRNQVLGTLIDLQDIWLEAYLPEELYGRVRMGDKIEITSFSYPEKKFQGKVSFIGLKAEFTPRNIQTIEGRKDQVFKIKVDIDNSENLFRPGMDLNLNLSKFINSRKKK